jgi:hypothetical protein
VVTCAPVSDEPERSRPVDISPTLVVRLRVLARELGPELSPDDLQSLGAFEDYLTAAVHTGGDGTPSKQLFRLNQFDHNSPLARRCSVGFEGAKA